MKKDINNHSAGVRMGQRIKAIREARGMTRAELGSFVGLDQNRVQQYENGWRKPKLPLLKKFAYALRVNVLAFMDPALDSYVGVMHTLFRVEEKFDMRVVKKDGGYCLQFGDGKTGRMNGYLQEWHDVRKALDYTTPNLTEEERKKKVLDYNMFRWTFPGINPGAGEAYHEKRNY